MSKRKSNVDNPVPLSSDPEVRKVASLLRGAMKRHPTVSELEEWVQYVEQSDRKTRILATQAYVVFHEERDPVSSRFYNIVGGTPSQGTKYYIGPTLTFIALAAASGVVGNLAYDALKAVVLPFLSPKERATFEERVTFEEYETVRKEVHIENAGSDTETIRTVEKEVGLKHRLLIERKEEKP